MTNNKILPPFHAFGLAIMAYFLFTVGDAMGKWLQGSYSLAQILVFVNVVGLAWQLAAAARIRGRREMFKSTKWPLHAVRALLMAGGTMMVLYALQTLRLAEFYGIIFLNPIWVAILSSVFLKQKIPLSRWAAIMVGFMGVLVIAGPQLVGLNAGVLAALGASLTGAIAALLARQIGGHEPPTNFSIATHAGMIMLSLPLMFGDYVTPSWPDLGLMALYGTILTIAMISLTLVFARSHVVSQVAPLQYTQMLWGVLIGWLFFGNPPTLQILMGSMLVIAAGLYILRSLHRGRLMNH